ncbi:MAG: HAD family hydrolase [Ruminiclostridium sp.]|nr:HAD family hydrolase [Ruminiclostridium sp.]
MKKDIKMIVTDLDRTLLRSDKTISDYTAKALNRCREKGIKVIYATARPARVTRRFCMAVQPDIIIADNGAVIDYGGKAIHHVIIPNEIANRLIAKCLYSGRVSTVTAETGECLFSNYSGEPWDADWNAWKLKYTNFSEEISVPMTKISIESRDFSWLRTILADYPSLHLYINSGEPWSQIIHRDATKWNAIKRLSSNFEVLSADIAAFGDDYNDIEMLQNCGIGVAVANALDEAKVAANFVCGSNDEDGVAKWLEENVL